MKKFKQETKKNIVRVIMLILAILMIMSFVMLPISESVFAAESEGDVIVTEFETGSLSAAIDKAKDGTDLNLITSLSVSGGVMNAADYSAVCGYPNITRLMLAGCETEDGIIPDNALQSRNHLEYISLPSNTKAIGSRAFSGNRALLKLDMPATVRSIGDYAFEGCENVETFNVPAELESMGTGAFSDCKKLSSFALPAAITEIPAYCFSKCSFTEMHFGPQVKKIGDGAFSDCHSLTDIYFYGTEAFEANESAFQNLKVTVHTYTDNEGFDSLESNFVSIGYDMSEDSEYIPPKTAGSNDVYTQTSYESSSESSAADESETKADNSSAEEDNQKQTTAAEEKTSVSDTAEQTENAVPAQVTVQSGFSGIAVAVIAVLCAALAVTITLLVVKSKK